MEGQKLHTTQFIKRTNQFRLRRLTVQNDQKSVEKEILPMLFHL